MNLLDKAILEWAWQCDKGYPDINSQEDVALFESMFGFNLNEASYLTPANLAKEKGRSGERRIDILIDKIAKGKELETRKGLFTVHDPKGQIVSALEKWDVSHKAVTLTDKDGNSITTSDLIKTKDFGGGAGSGGGAAKTDLQESAQCLVNAVAFNVVGNKITIADLTPEILTKANNYVNTTSGIEEMIQFCQGDESWQQSLVGTANSLLKDFGKQNWQFHRGSDFVNSIYNAWKKAKKTLKLTAADDKWNPSDIWAVDSSAIGTAFPEDVEKLNKLLIDLYEAKQLVGISLKKTSKPTLSVYNKTPEDTAHTYAGYKTTPNSKDAYIQFSNGKEMQFRTFNTAGGFQGEIKGAEANQGKIGGGIVSSLMQKHGLPALPVVKDIKRRAEELQDDFIEEFGVLYKKYTGSGKALDREELESKSLDWLVSKYNALKVVDIFKNGNAKDIKKVSNDLLLYAGSRSSISSVYVKVG